MPFPFGKNFIGASLIDWALAFGFAAPLVARVGLYDYEGEWWWWSLQALPVVSLVAVLTAPSSLKRFFSLRQFGGWSLALHAALFAAALAGTVWMLGSGHDAPVRFCNAYDQRIVVAIGHRPNRLGSQTEGHWSLAPGECQEVTKNFLRVPVKYLFHAAIEVEFTTWLDGDAPTWDFDRSDLLGVMQGAGVPAYPPGEAPARKLQGEEVAWEHAEVRPVTRGWFNYVNDAPDWPAPKHLAPFIEVVPAPSGDLHTIWFSKGGVTKTLEICNLQPVTASLELYHQSKRREWKVETGFEIEPGFCQTFERNFQRVAPAFWVRAAISGEVVEWTLGENELVLEGDESLEVCVPDGGRVSVSDDPLSEGVCAAGESQMSFARVPDSATDGPHETFNLALPEEVIPLPTRDERIDLEKAKVKIRQLARLWPQRMEYLKKSGGRPPLFTLGIAVDEFVSHNELGVTVTRALEQTPFGTPSSFKKNDVIVEFDNSPIYSPIDLEMAMINFGNSRSRGGVLKTFSYKAWRGDVLEERQGTLFFNPSAWPHVAAERAAAAGWGFSNGVSFGLAVQLYCAAQKARAWWYEQRFDYADCTWETQQFVARMKQFYWDDYNDANFIGKLASLVPSVMAVRVVARVLGGGIVAEVVAGGGVTALETAGWVYEEALPGANLNEELRAAVIPAAAIGALSALILRP